MEKEVQYNAIVADHKDAIYRMCRCYVRDDDARSDVYQQVLIHIWENLDAFEGRSHLGTWIYRIAVNTCLGFLRSERRRQKIFLAGGEAAEASMLNYPAAEATGEDDDEVKELYDRINALPGVDRTIISLYLEELSTKEMAEILDISEANVRVKIHRIKKTLKDGMERERHGLGPS